MIRIEKIKLEKIKLRLIGNVFIFTRHEIAFNAQLMPYCRFREYGIPKLLKDAQRSKGH